MSAALGARAADYAARGWPVFPCRERGKEPLTSEGFKNATTDPEQVAAWWREHPGANIGLIPGAAGLLVIDLDGPEGEEAAATLGLLSEPTLAVQTGRPDGGRHLYFRRPEGPTIGNRSLAPHLDVRCDAGYVLIPPSVHPSGRRYRWCGKLQEVLPVPPAVLELLRRDGGRPAVAPSVGDAIPTGERNNVLTSLAGTMRRRGMGEAEIVAALLETNSGRCSPPLPDDEVRRIAQSVSAYEPATAVSRSQSSKDARTPSSLRTRCLADVEPEAVTWLWPGRLPRGKIALLEGDPGLGKSTLLFDLAARLSVGCPTPDGQPLPTGQTIIVTAEDGLADTVRPRIDAAGGDASRIHAVEGVEDAGAELPFTLPAHALGLRDAIREYAADLVIIDPLVAYLGGDTNTHRDGDIRRALRPLAMIAEETRAVIVFIRHLNKSVGGSALYRGGGSIGIIAAVRAAHLVARDPDDETRRVFAPVKSNLGPEAASLVFRLEDDGHGRARIRWEGTSEHRAGGLVAMPPEEDERGGADRARALLLEALAEGPRAQREVVREVCQAADVSDRTVRRVAVRMGVVSARRGFGRGAAYTWEFPHAGHALAMANMENTDPRTPPENLGNLHAGHAGQVHAGQAAWPACNGDPDEAARAAMREGA